MWKKSGDESSFFRELNTRILVMSSFQNKERKLDLKNWLVDLSGNKIWHVEKSRRKNYPIKPKTWQKLTIFINIYNWRKTIIFSLWFFLHDLTYPKYTEQKNLSRKNGISILFILFQAETFQIWLRFTEPKKLLVQKTELKNLSSETGNENWVYVSKLKTFQNPTGKIRNGKKLPFFQTLNCRLWIRFIELIIVSSGDWT